MRTILAALALLAAAAPSHAGQALWDVGCGRSSCQASAVFSFPSLGNQQVGLMFVRQRDGTSTVILYGERWPRVVEAVSGEIDLVVDGRSLGNHTIVRLMQSALIGVTPADLAALAHGQALNVRTNAGVLAFPLDGSAAALKELEAAAAKLEIDSSPPEGNQL